MKESKNYYTIIPSAVRYDKRLKPLSKLIYGEITALTNDKGYCWANNNYFAEIYSVSKDTISRAVRQLEEYGYIKCIYDKTKQNNEKRKIYIKKSVSAKKSIRCSKNSTDGIDKKVEDNNKDNNLNNKDNESYNKKDSDKINKTDNINSPPIVLIHSLMSLSILLIFLQEVKLVNYIKFILLKLNTNGRNQIYFR
ncbi:helix-turn-helix domain-containing protein [Brachyspira hyodysenteriae]|uniref:helix-turn-helix domain-containing protein n=1 Tax=Brachyspira hyodysenteriae TaxID=159 RepID=UPI003BF5462A